MAKKKGKSDKDPFELAPPEFKESINGATDEEVNAKIAEVALNDAALEEAKKADQDLADKKASAKEAGLVYANGRKQNRAKIGYARSVLSARGKPSGESGVE